LREISNPEKGNTMITTTVTKNVVQTSLNSGGQSQSITPPANSSYSLTGVQGPPVEASVPVATPLVLVDGFGTLRYANLNFLYMLSDSLDCTVQFYTGTDGATGAIGSPITIQAGTAYEWDSSSGTSPLGTSNAGSCKITATNYIDTVASGGTPTSTNIHFRSSLTG
jgi:hypothetical protein